MTGKAALSLLAAGLPLLADFDAREWRLRRAVQAAGGCLAAFEIDADVYRDAKPGLEDLRLSDGVSELPYVLTRVCERRESALEFERSEDRAARATVLTARAPVPFDSVRLETPAPAFDRSVEISVSEHGDRWRWAGSGSIHRTPGRERLEVLLNEQRGPWVRIRIFNRDDRPLPVSRAVIGRTARRILFTPSNGPVWLYYGNRRAHAAEYDFARTLPACEPAAATLGRAEANPAFRPPWTEGGHHWTLYAALAAAVLALGATIVRFWTRLRTNTLSS